MRLKRAPKPRATAHEIAYEPDLVPPPELMRSEGIAVLEEWFRWAEEWSMLLRVYGRVRRESSVLEIGCGLGRTAFPLRYVLSRQGRYAGFEIARAKVDFLQRVFTPAHPNFTFTWADVHNTHYNPGGRIAARDYTFPYDDAAFDIVYAASVFTHMLPEAAARYISETARVLEPGGRALFSFFLLDFYVPGHPRPLGFARAAFDFDHPLGHHGDAFAVVEPQDPERMTAYRLELIERLAHEAGLELAAEPVRGLWSGTAETWVGAQDLVTLVRPA
jgi:SAM-dependent methyltransferase